MTIASVPPVTGGVYATTPTRAPKQTLDANAFMTLLVTQLKNQDPSSPMDTGQMISQTTQLAMMQQVTQQTTTSTENFSLQMRIAAAALVGEQVSYLDKNGTSVTGTASAVSFAGSVPQITVGGTDISLDSITGVTRSTSASSSTPTP